ncbi:discoidin domain-containing protein [Nocardioides sp. W3-2-3]|uniref:discoidin domain-containing protein n=1 Tax=Nocardioides convexus TaxID=2712224 RepID=UPI002418A76E|nr:discoidin domain-containing protein [Nocardioides convexus]NGZ99944.1 discoidin domain-containing protein [Nocardioides convexus]
MVVAGSPRCAARTQRSGEDGTTLRRSFALAGTRTYDVAVTAVPRPGAALDALLLRGQAASVQVSSTAVPDPRAGATAAVDGDGTTAWLAGADDERASISLSWLGVRNVRGIDLDLVPATAARRPTDLVLTFWNGRSSTQRRVEPGRGRQRHLRAGARRAGRGRGGERGGRDRPAPWGDLRRRTGRDRGDHPHRRALPAHGPAERAADPALWFRAGRACGGAAAADRDHRLATPPRLRQGGARDRVRRGDGRVPAAGAPT